MKKVELTHSDCRPGPLARDLLFSPVILSRDPMFFWVGGEGSLWGWPIHELDNSLALFE